MFHADINNLVWCFCVRMSILMKLADGWSVEKELPCRIFGGITPVVWTSGTEYWDFFVRSQYIILVISPLLFFTKIGTYTWNILYVNFLKLYSINWYVLDILPCSYHVCQMLSVLNSWQRLDWQHVNCNCSKPSFICQFQFCVLLAPFCFAVK